MAEETQAKEVASYDASGTSVERTDTEQSDGGETAQSTQTADTTQTSEGQSDETTPDVSEAPDPSKVVPMETSSVDLWKFHNESVTLDKPALRFVPSQYSKIGKQWVLKVQSVPLEHLGEGENAVEFRASELFNLIQNEAGALEGFPISENASLVKFCHDIGLKPENASNLQELMQLIEGKSATVKAYDKSVQGKTKTYLKFKY